MTDTYLTLNRKIEPQPWKILGSTKFQKVALKVRKLWSKGLSKRISRSSLRRFIRYVSKVKIVSLSISGLYITSYLVSGTFTKNAKKSQTCPKSPKIPKISKNHKKTKNHKKSQKFQNSQPFEIFWTIYGVNSIARHAKTTYNCKLCLHMCLVLYLRLTHKQFWGTTLKGLPTRGL